MHFLLLQARMPDDPVLTHERICFRETLGTIDAQLRTHDLLGGSPALAELESVDCVLVGGSGDFGVGETDEHPWLSDFVDFMGKLVERGFPTFASCFGFQALVLAGGGEVVSDPSRAEVGTFEIEVTVDGAQDPLFADLAPRFHAQMGHRDHATRLPGGVTHLASSERSPYQAFTIPGKPLYATQFHPENSMRRNRERFSFYVDAYTGSNLVDPAQTVMASFRESHAASTLLGRFVEQVRPGRSVS